jgi:low temperature requirement protein LtrA
MKGKENVQEKRRSMIPTGPNFTVCEAQAGTSKADRVHAPRLSKNFDDKSLYGVIGRFFTAPCPRQVWGPDGESVAMDCPEIGWMELFLDLVFVGYFVILAKGVEYCDDFDADGVLFCFGHFVLLWGTRNVLDVYLNRFSLSHNLTMCVFFLFTGGMVMMSINTGYTACTIDDEPLWVLQSFVFGLVMSRLTVLGLCVYTYYHNRELLGDVVFDGAMIVVQCTLMIASVYNTDIFYIAVGVDFMFCPLELIFNSAARYLSRAWKRSPHPVNHSATQERQAIWVVLVLGETIICIAKVSPENVSDRLIDMYVYTIGTAVMMFAIGGAYFETCCVHEHGTERVHALRRNKWAGAFWICCHAAVSFFVFLIGPLTSLILREFENSDEKDIPGESRHDRHISEHQFESEQEDKILEFANYRSVVLCTIHFMLILMSRAHENFIHPTAGLSEWRLDAKPWYVVVEVAFAMLHLAVAAGVERHGIDIHSYETWTPLIHTLIFVGPRLIVTVQQLLFVLADVSDTVITKIGSASSRKSVDLHSLWDRDSMDRDIWAKNNLKKDNTEDGGNNSPLHQHEQL